MNSRRTTLRIESLEARRLLSANAGQDSQSDTPPFVANIVGGNVAEQDWPMMVSLSDGNGHFCGGTLIASDIVVTAGHCLDDVSTATLTVVIGRSDLSSTEGESIQVSEVIIHPEFNEQQGFDADLAIVRLSAPTMYDFVPIVRAQDLEFAAPGSNAIALGWGALDNGFNPAFPKKLHRVDIPIVSNAVANQPQGYNGRITQRMLPAGAVGKDTCGGDSGGPLLVQDRDGDYILAGVTSFGSDTGCGVENAPGIYTRISSFENWLEQFVSPPTIGRIGFHANKYVKDSSARITLRDADLAGAGTFVVALSSSHGDSESLMLTELKPGIFVGDIQLSSGLSEISNGKLEVAERGTIEVHYEDVDFWDGVPRFVNASAGIFGDDHGDAIGASTQMPLNTDVSGELELPGDIDSFAIVLSAGVSYEISTTLTGLDDTVLTVRNADGVVVAENDDAGGLAASKIRWEPYSAGTYFVEVSGYSDSTGDYLVRVQETQESDDHRNGPLSATLVSLGLTEGNIEDDIDRDWFQFDAISGVSYIIEVQTIGLVDSYLRLLDSDGVTQLEFSDDIPNGLSSRIDWEAPRSGRFFAEVTGWAGDRGSYALVLSSLIAPDAFEANDFQTESAVWSDEAAMENLSIHEPDDVDWYQWIPAGSGPHTFSLESVGGNAVVHLIGTSGELLGASETQQDHAMSITFSALANQEIFIQVEGFGESSVVPQYNMSIHQGFPSIVGDLNDDRIANIDDVDLLCMSIRDKSTDIVFDLNHDSSIDLRDLDFMVEDVLKTVLGDVTLDKQFDSSDFVSVFAFHQYEDGIAGNSVWSSGDWNCDGEFDTKDLINAFSRATYSRVSPTAHVVSVGDLSHRRDEELHRRLQRY